MTVQRTKSVQVRFWGRWYLDFTPPVSLNINLTPWWAYEIVLSQCRTEHDREMWIEHMAEKTQLVSRKDVRDLTRAFADLGAAGMLEQVTK